MEKTPSRRTSKRSFLCGKAAEPVEQAIDMSLIGDATMLMCRYSRAVIIKFNTRSTTLTFITLFLITIIKSEVSTISHGLGLDHKQRYALYVLLCCYSKHHGITSASHRTYIYRFIYIYIYIFIYIYIYVHIYVCVYIYIYICVCVCVCVLLDVNMLIFSLNTLSHRTFCKLYECFVLGCNEMSIAISYHTRLYWLYLLISPSKHNHHVVMTFQYD